MGLPWLGYFSGTLEMILEEQEELVQLATSRSLPHAFVERARLVMLSADGRSIPEIATRLRGSDPSVGIGR
jgi:hypothetical protein